MSRVCGESVKLGKLFVKRAPYKTMEIAVTIGLVGNIHGYVVYTMDLSAAIYLASRILNDPLVTDMDEMSQSALSELANMISGASATILFSMDTTIDITTPTYVRNGTPGNFPFVRPETQVLCMPMSLRDGSIFEVDVVME